MEIDTLGSLEFDARRMEILVKNSLSMVGN